MRGRFKNDRRIPIPCGDCGRPTVKQKWCVACGQARRRAASRRCAARWRAAFAKQPQAPCLVELCDRKAGQARRGLCRGHHERARLGRPLTLLVCKQGTGKAPCAALGCDRVSQARGLCSRHYQRWTSGRDIDRIFGDPVRPCLDCGAELRPANPLLSTLRRCPGCKERRYKNSDAYVRGLITNDRILKGLGIRMVPMALIALKRAQTNLYRDVRSRRSK